MLDVAGLDALIGALRRRGYDRHRRRPFATARSSTTSSTSAAELPTGWTDVQDGGRYRLERRDDDARFGYAVGPTSWKRFLFPPRIRLWHATPGEPDGLEVEEEPLVTGRLRSSASAPCELAAIAIQDRVFVGGRYVDRDYAARRENVLLVAVNCHEPGGTCFCVSMDTGPHVRERYDYDLVLTELLDGGHRFLVEAGSERGAEILAELGGAEATDDDLRAAADQAERRSRPDGPHARHPRHPRPAASTTSSTRAGTRSPSAA